MGGGYRSSVAVCILAVIVATGIYGFLHTSMCDGIPNIAYNFIALFTCELCAIGIIGSSYYVKPFWNKGMTIVSAISYELYIIHGYFVRGLDGTIYGLLLFILGVVVCSLVLYLIERFINRLVGVKR